MRVWRFFMIVLGVMVVTGALGGAVGGLVAYAMQDTSNAILNARPDRWFQPPAPGLAPPAPSPAPAPAPPAGPKAGADKPETPPPAVATPPHFPIIPIEELIARGAALLGALALLVGGCVGLLLAILDQFIVFSRMAMTMIAAGPGGSPRRGGPLGSTGFTPPTID